MAILVETGPMFSGKSGVLVESIKRRIIGNQKQGIDFLAFTFAGDKRYGEGVLSSHSRAQVSAIPIFQPRNILTVITVKKNNNFILKKKYFYKWGSRLAPPTMIYYIISLNSDQMSDKSNKS